MAVFAIPGHEAALKISRPVDLVIAEAPGPSTRYADSAPDTAYPLRVIMPRVDIGTDVHAFAAHRAHTLLGGVG